MTSFNSDSHVLAALMLIRDIQDRLKAGWRKDAFASDAVASKVQQWNKAKRHACSIVCELLDFRTQQTIGMQNREMLRADFVQSNRLISQVLAMVTENRGVKTILDELLGSKGCSLGLTHSAQYVRPVARDLIGCPMCRTQHTPGSGASSGTF